MIDDRRTWDQAVREAAAPRERKTSWPWRALCGLMFLGLPMPAIAASSMPPTQLPVLGMQVVRSNSVACVGHCSDWIALQGPIGVGSAAAFTRFIHALGSRRLPVLVASNGGSVRDGMAIGRLIRAKHLDVAVSRTTIAPCPTDGTVCLATAAPRGVVLGTPEISRSVCASACSFILAAGERRFVALQAIVGVHQFRSFEKITQVMRTFRTTTEEVGGETVKVRRIVAERPISSRQVAVKTSGAAYDEAQRYFASMGIAPTLMTLAEATVPASIHWLSLAELVSTHMDTEGKDGAFLIAHATAEPPLPEPPQRVASAQTPVSASITAPPPIGEPAMLVSDEAVDRRAIHLAGTAVWSVDLSRPVPTLLATIALPEGAGSATVRLDDGATGPGRPDYRIELTLQPGPQSPFARVLAVGIPSVRIVPDQPPVDLPCKIGPPALGTYTIDLSADKAAIATTRRLLARGGTLEFPFVSDTLRQLRITLVRGPSGMDAFQRWRALVDARLPAG